MSATRYLEFDSTYRDRNLYPEPAEFVAEISQSGQRPRDTARDPISEVSPILFWNSSFDETTAATSVTITGLDVTSSPSDPITFIIEAAANDLRNVDNYYVGAVLQITDGAGVVVRRRILEYERISTTQAQVTTDIALPSTFPSGGVAAGSNIENPSNNTNTFAVPKVFVPVSEPINNFYINYMIQNLTTGESFTITEFDGETRLATISGNTAASWNVANNNFIIRKVSPTNTGNIQAINSGLPTTSVVLGTSRAIQLASTASSLSGAYVSSFLRMVEPVPTAAGFSTLVSPYSEEKRIGSYIAGDGVFIAHGGAGTNTFTLDFTTSSATDNTYVGALITDVTSGETREIITYNGATHAGTVANNWTAGAAGDVWRMRTVLLINGFTIPPVVGAADAYELELFSRDSFTPFSYSGSLVSSQEMICYELELLNLCLPNTTLSSGRGGRPIFYPYLYVELQQASAAGGGQRNILYSMNPNSSRMLFRAVVDDTSQPVNSPFVRIDSDGIVQTVKFRPNDSFRFAVFHADGTLFRTVAQDTEGPTPPNPLVQISACFSLKKV